MKYLLILLLVIGCGTRKTSQQSTTFKSDSLTIENKRVLKQEIILKDIYSIKPFNVLKPMIIEGKEYFNVTIDFDKTNVIINTDEKLDSFKKGSVSQSEKNKETEKTDYTILYLGMFFILCLFIFLWFKFKRPI